MLFYNLFQVDMYVIMCMCKCFKKRLKFHGDRPVEKLMFQKTHLPHFHTVFCAKLLN